MVEPGSALPGDEECAARVAAAAEVQAGNATYNANPGGHRLPAGFFDVGSNDRRANADIAARVSGAFTGTTPEIVQWTACKWGIDERIVRAQVHAESTWRQTRKGDFGRDEARCPPGHGHGVDGRPGECPESWGLMQIRYPYYRGAFPGVINSTSFNTDVAYAVWRACYEGYELWLLDYPEPGYRYGPGDEWGCVGRWYSGSWYNKDARAYIACIQRAVQGRETCS
jgi:autotransporter family porin